MAIVQLPAQDILPAVLAGTGRSGQCKKIGPLGDTAQGAGLHRRGADLLVGKHAEEFPKSLDPLLQHLLEGFRSGIAAGDAGTAGGDHCVDMRILDAARQEAYDCLHLVTADLAAHHFVTIFADEPLQGISRTIFRGCAAVRNGKDSDLYCQERALFIDAMHAMLPSSQAPINRSRLPIAAEQVGRQTRELSRRACRTRTQVRRAEAGTPAIPGTRTAAIRPRRASGGTESPAPAASGTSRSSSVPGARIAVSRPMGDSR